VTASVDATAAGSGQPEPDDAGLARRVARGDRVAAALLVDRHQGPVRAFLRRLTFDAHLAEDLTQETMLRMLRHAHQYDPQHAMKTWLLTIARRLWIDHLRRRARAAEAALPAEVASAAGPTRRATDLDHADRQRLLAAALAQLSEPQRCAVVMFYQQQMSVEAVAAAMAMSENTVKSHLHRARARLRELLEPQRESIMP